MEMVFGFAMGSNFLQRETLLIQAAFGAKFRKSDLWQVRKLIGTSRLNNLKVINSPIHRREPVHSANP